MRHEILGRPDYAVARIHLDPGESIWAESDAMVAHSGLDLETSARGGVVAGLARKMLTSESFFQNRWTARDRPGRIDLAPGVPGDVLHVPLDGRLLLQRGSYMASTEGVEVTTEVGGLKTFMAEGDFFVLAAEGKGELFLASYGAIERIDVDGEYAVDNGHLVAWEDTLDHQIRRVGGWKATLLSREGLVVRLTGRGTVWIQSRSIPPFVAWVNPFRKKKSSDD